MYLFIYKTTHKNGKFYIGRHQTNNLDDGYLGSGKWVTSVKDKSTLSREIVEFSDDINSLYELEEHYINLYWETPLCMNMKKASVGLSSEDASRNVKKQIENGTHNFSTKPDGSSLTSDRAKNGTNPFLRKLDGSSVGLETNKKRVEKGIHQFLTRSDGSSVASDRVKNGTHNLLKRADGSSHASDRVEKGIHHFLTRSDGSSVASEANKKLVENGTHQFLTRSDGSSVGKESAEKRLKNGTHNFLEYKGLVPCYDKLGNYVRIPKELYHSQSGLMEDREWVFNTSKEGKRRKLLKL